MGYDPIKHRLVWTTKLKQLTAAARQVLPKDEAVKELQRNANALHLSVAAGADETSTVLIDRCRASVNSLKYGDIPEALFVAAFKADSRKSLNRVVNMIRNNYPSAEEPKELARV